MTKAPAASEIADQDEDPTLDLRIAAPGWAAALGRDEAAVALWAERAVRAAARAAGASEDKVSVSMLLTHDAEIQALNARFRDQDKATNVLSWPAFAFETPWPETVGPGAPDPAAEAGRIGLGDVALALETCVKEAEAAGLALEAHAAHLIVHGTLHLLGYDHGSDVEAEAMAAREIAALAELGLEDPYARRGGAA